MLVEYLKVSCRQPQSMSTEGDTMAFTPDDKKIIDLVVDGGGSTEASDDALIDELNKG